MPAILDSLMLFVVFGEFASAKLKSFPSSKRSYPEFKHISLVYTAICGTLCWLWISHSFLVCVVYEIPVSEPLSSLATFAGWNSFINADTDTNTPGLGLWGSVSHLPFPEPCWSRCLCEQQQQPDPSGILGTGSDNFCINFIFISSVIYQSDVCLRPNRRWVLTNIRETCVARYTVCGGWGTGARRPILSVGWICGFHKPWMCARVCGIGGGGECEWVGVFSALLIIPWLVWKLLVRPEPLRFAYMDEVANGYDGNG